MIFVVLGSEVTSPERQRQTEGVVNSAVGRVDSGGAGREVGGGAVAEGQRHMERWVGRRAFYSGFMYHLQQWRRIERNREIFGVISTTSKNE